MVGKKHRWMLPYFIEEKSLSDMFLRCVVSHVFNNDIIYTCNGIQRQKRCTHEQTTEKEQVKAFNAGGLKAGERHAIIGIWQRPGHISIKER